MINQLFIFWQGMSYEIKVQYYAPIGENVFGQKSENFPYRGGPSL